MSNASPRLAVVGPGLIGSSVALAAARRWPGVRVTLVDRADPLDVIRDATVVVLAAPVDAIIGALPRVAALVTPETLVMDTGSTKRAIVRAAADAGIRRFVGGHPMAGGTASGPAGARADLFDGRPWFLANPVDPVAIADAEAFIEALGAQPIRLNDHGEEHDRIMAAVSHLPQLTASALMAVVARAVSPEGMRWAGAGLRDTTRLAASSADVWQSVLATNSAEIKPLLLQLAADLAALADRLEDRDAVRQLFNEAASAKASCL